MQLARKSDFEVIEVAFAKDVLVTSRKIITIPGSDKLVALIEVYSHPADISLRCTSCRKTITEELRNIGIDTSHKNEVRLYSELIGRTHTLKIKDVGVISILDVNTNEVISDEKFSFELETSLNRVLQGLYSCDECLTAKFIARKISIRRVK